MEEIQEGNRPIADIIQSTKMSDYSEYEDRLHHLRIKDYEIRIKLMDKGAALEIGCKSFAFNTKEEMLQELTLYITDPKKAVEKYKEIFN